jgi:hypothetical protein
LDRADAGMKRKMMHKQAIRTQMKGQPRPVDTLRLLSTLRWLIPLSLMLLVVVYELGPAAWVFNRFGFQRHQLAEIIIFGTVGPALAFTLLNFLGRWLDERDTSNLQSRILAQAREDARTARQLCDDAVQVMFSAGALIDSLKAHQPELPANAAGHAAAIQQALDKSVRAIRSHLEKPPQS